LATVFADAAIPQKLVMLALLLALLAALVAAAREFSGKAGGARRSTFVSELRVGGPALGLFVGALNAFHMAQTTLRLPSTPTSKDLAPAIMEIAVLVGLGALTGLVAVALHAILARPSRR
jgi:hypothetical protein